MGPELTIVIPAKNEVEMLPKLLESLCRQDYEGDAGYEGCWVADAGGSTGWGAGGGGAEISRSVEGWRLSRVGLPSVGRNAGARLATTKYVLFSGCGCRVAGTYFVAARRCGGWRAAACCIWRPTNIACREGGFFDDVLYAGTT